MDLTYDLAPLPDGAVFHAGVAELTRLDGRPAMRISLTEQMTRYDVPGVGRLDLPTFISLPIWFEDGTIEVDVHCGVPHGAHRGAEPLAGLAYRVAGDRERFDAVHVRPLNGTCSAPASARTRRVAQFIAQPDLPFDQIGPETRGRGTAVQPISDTWTHLTVHIDGTRLASLVDGVEAIVIPVTRAAATRGDLGLFVDVGTEAYFSHLMVIPA